jgi:hypothetical protein
MSSRRLSPGADSNPRPKGILLIDVEVLYPLGYLACPWQTAPIYLPFEIENVTEGK